MGRVRWISDGAEDGDFRLIVSRDRRHFVEQPPEIRPLWPATHS